MPMSLGRQKGSRGVESYFFEGALKKSMQNAKRAKQIARQLEGLILILAPLKRL